MDLLIHILVILLFHDTLKQPKQIFLIVQKLLVLTRVSFKTVKILKSRHNLETIILNRPKPQQGKKSLKSFDSSNPELPNKDLLDEKNDDGFKVAGPKKPKQKKSTIDSHLKDSGQGQNIGFDACECKMEVLLGRVDIKVGNKSVEEYVKKTVKIYN
ncbi:unnamed protein product [Brachionus calyciflorus]|uniref:Uncharacterized protein n=1 Tax=Brachionus calyciflorus TaxID=104777 RepID=A0A813ZT90_9BILA|nr:unnamed protein product [Brachionus calyciflorus]